MLPRLGPQPGDQRRDAGRAEARGDHQHVRDPRHEAQRRHVLHRVVAEVGKQRRGDRLGAAGGEEEGVAIGGAGDRLGRHHAAAAGAVLHHHAAAELGGQRRGEDAAGDIGGAAGGEGHDDAQRRARPGVLRPGGQGGGRGGGQGGGEGGSSGRAARARRGRIGMGQEWCRSGAAAEGASLDAMGGLVWDARPNGRVSRGVFTRARGWAGIVIVGAGHAGGSAAAFLRQYGWKGAITLLGEEPGLPYQRPPLSKAWLKGEATAESLLLRPARFYAQFNIETRLGTVVAGIDRRRGRCASRMGPPCPCPADPGDRRAGAPAGAGGGGAGRRAGAAQRGGCGRLKTGSARAAAGGDRRRLCRLGGGRLGPGAGRRGGGGGARAAGAGAGGRAALSDLRASTARRGSRSEPGG